MKKILVFLTAIICLLSCKEDANENWIPDSLVVTVTGDLPEEKGKIFNAGDGNWGVNVKSAFNGDLMLDVKSDKSWDVIVKYITYDEEEWILPAKSGSSGNEAFSITIKANKTVLYRKASVTIRTKGDIPVDKTITIIQTDSEPIIEFNPLTNEDATYDIETRTLTVSYIGSQQVIGFWSNIENYMLKVLPENTGDDISWIKGFSVSEKEGTISFTTANNFTGIERRAIIRLEADGFEGADYYLVQKPSLYKNILLTIDGKPYTDSASAMIYSMKGRTIVLEFDSDQTLQAELIDKTTSQPVTGWASATLNGKQVTIALTSNTGGTDRAAILRVKSTDGSLSQQPVLEWTFTQKNEVLNVILNHKIEQDLLVFGPNMRRNATIVLGTYETSDEAVRISSTPPWLSLTVQEGVIKLKNMDMYSGVNPRTAEVVLANVNGEMTKTIKLTQYGEKDIIAKSSWKVELANNHTGESVGKEKELMFDGKWRMDADDKNSFWESNGGSPNYEFIFDLSSDQIYNSIGIMPRQQWPTPAPKDIWIEVSNDKQTWYSLGKFAGFEKTEVEENATNCYAKQIKWCQFPTMKARYIRLSLGETHWTNVCCIEEIFVELQ